MNAKTILLGTDFSPLSRAALEWAATIAGATGAKLLIATVEPGQPTSHFGSIYRGLPDPGIADLAKTLAEFVPSHPAAAVEHRILQGEAAAELIKCAAEEKVDLVVLGSHGRSGLKHLMLGSVAEAVLRGAHCPVLICKSAATPAGV